MSLRTRFRGRENGPSVTSGARMHEGAVADVELVADGDRAVDATDGVEPVSADVAREHAAATEARAIAPKPSAFLRSIVRPRPGAAPSPVAMILAPSVRSR
jgi:hypothetical protein